MSRSKRHPIIRKYIRSMLKEDIGLLSLLLGLSTGASGHGSSGGFTPSGGGRADSWLGDEDWGGGYDGYDDFGDDGDDGDDGGDD